MKIATLTKQQCLELLGSEATDSEALALLDILKKTTFETTRDIPDERWNAIVRCAVWKAAHAFPYSPQGDPQPEPSADE